MQSFSRVFPSFVVSFPCSPVRSTVFVCLVYFVVSSPHAVLFPYVSVFCAFFPWASCAQLLLVYPSPICDAGCRLLVYLLLSIMCSLRGGAGGAGAQHSPLVGKARLRALHLSSALSSHYTPKP